MRILPAMILVLLALPPLYAGEREIVELQSFFLQKQNYEAAITEGMRYHYLYPQGAFADQALLLTGRAWFLGGDYFKAMDIFNECRARQTPEAETALRNIAMMRMVEGSALWGYKTWNEYLRVYPQGQYREEALLYAALAQGLAGAPQRGLEKLGALELDEAEMRERSARYAEVLQMWQEQPQKSEDLAFYGSFVLPGFAHFYVGDWWTGAVNLLSNVLCIAGIVHGVRNENIPEAVFFSLAELTFYGYSFKSSLPRVREYNSGYEYEQRLRLMLRHEF